MTLDDETAIRYLYPQFEDAIKEFSQDEDWFVDVGKKGNIVSVARSVNLCYCPHPSYHLNLGVAYSSLVRKGGYEDFDSLPSSSKLKFPLIGLSDYDVDEGGRVTTPFGIVPRFIIGSDGKLYTVQNYYFLSAVGQSVKVEEITKIQGDNQTLEEVLKELEEGDIPRLPFSLRRRGKDSWRRGIGLRGGDLEKLGFLLGEMQVGKFRRWG